MFKKAPLAAVLVVLALSGCSAATGGPEARSPAAEETATPTTEATLEPTAEPTPTAAPVEIVPTEAPGVPEFNGFASQREWYLKSLDGALSGTVSDDDLIAAGMLACEQMRNGETLDTARVVTGTGEAADQDNNNILWAAYYVYCPETN
jgi:PBP1b-binding outer membrane lipoprotein LpoB